MRCFLWVLLLLLMFLVQQQNMNVIHGCLEEELEALLLLKASMIDITATPHSMLATWEKSNRSSRSYCCHWERVKCSKATGRVISLNLEEAIFDPRTPDSKWYMNSSLLLPFQQLQSIDLSYNYMYGTLEGEGFERLRALKNLEVLDLRGNHLDNEILPPISTLKSLKILILFYNDRMKESLDHFEDLKNLSNLEHLNLGQNPLMSTSIMDYLGEIPMLKVLDLEGCELNGSIATQGIMKLSRLEELWLWGNDLDWTIMDSLGALSNLKILDLSNNNLNATIVSNQGFKKFSRLEELYLGENNLDDSILDSLAALPNLRTLDLSSNQLNGTASSPGLPVLGKKLESIDLTGNRIVDMRILDSLGDLSLLKKLDLSLNTLSGSISNQSGGLCSLKNLESLKLRSCHLEGTLPPCLGNLTALRLLDLTDNRFVGNIASSPIVTLTSLETLILSNNRFQSLIPFSSFANHSKLIKFHLDYIGDVGVVTDIIVETENPTNWDVGVVNDIIVETENPTNWVPTFQLQVFVLGNCKVNLPTGVLPSFLHHQKELRSLAMVETNLKATFPSWLLKNNTKLSFLNFQENSLTGTLLNLPLHPKLQTLIISHNHIKGYIPTNIDGSLPNLKFLDMSSNFFKGHIPSTFGDMQQLLFLDLSSNYLTGEVPESLAKGYSMEHLRLSNNRLHGYIFPRFFGASSVKCLSLDGNHFTGNIPVTLPNRQSLELLDIGNNDITGALPNWIGDMKSLQVLVLSKNHLIGPIPKSFCRLKSLAVLDLSKNNVTGHIPSCFSPPSLKYVNLRGNKLIGTLDNAAFTNSSQLTILDVGDNHIRSSIPCWIANHHQELRILVLKGNHFEGHIPIQLCRLQQLIMIDLSSNNLSGPIPSCLSNVTGNTSELFNPWFEILTEVVLDSYGQFIIGYQWQHSTEEHVEFASKKRVNVYEGKNVRFASGIDLSSNKLSGNIPPEIGNLSLFHTLNLSHNCLAGSIPETFSRLQSMECLDLSYNHLTGPIPAQLVDLNSLSNFSVAHNDLSGETPKRIGQFATFEESSYEDNPLLCGPPLKKNCSATNATPSTIASGTDDSSIDHVAFYASFAGAFVVGFFGVIVFLFINPYWRKIWFQMVDRSISATEYFLIDRFYKLKHLVCG